MDLKSWIKSYPNRKLRSLKMKIKSNRLCFSISGGCTLHEPLGDSFHVVDCNLCRKLYLRYQTESEEDKMIYTTYDNVSNLMNERA